MISALYILAADLETCLTYTLLPCEGFGLHPVPFLGSLDFIVVIFTSFPFPPPLPHIFSLSFTTVA